MKGFEKFILIVFSIVIIILSIGVILVSTEMINITQYINKGIGILVANKMPCLVVGSIFALFALVGLFSSSDYAEDVKTGLAIKNEKGTVYITKETFESIIVSVTRNYPELRNVKVDIKVGDTGVVANIYTMILPDTVVPTLTTKLQENIKSSILKQTTVEIKEANIKIKGVVIEPQKK